ncbi:hypothetical protein C900_00517 [Fulvivirga imtechensis AK7]|uniref:Uncharacterized protein n=1 Tax=Fulvivirga imtechensis AK7 TaxID=1237149 RepID=L8JLF9_9BACT|nr:hypothetical protein C900_00517 [Fulvivirga imtechensis AK7]
MLFIPWAHLGLPMFAIAQSGPNNMYNKKKGIAAAMPF